MVEYSKDKSAGANLLMQIGHQSVANRTDFALPQSKEFGSNDFFRQALGTAPDSWANPGDLVTSHLLSFNPTLASENDEQVFEDALRHLNGQPDAGALALLSTILHKAAHAHDDRLFFHYWLSENMRAWLGPRGFNLPGCTRELRALRQRIQNMLTLGINLRGRSPAEFLASQFRVSGDFDGLQLGAGYVLDSIVSAASFAGAGLLETVDVLSLLPHNRSDICGCFGLLAGTFYGKNRLMQLETLGESLSGFLSVDEIEEGELR